MNNILKWESTGFFKRKHYFLLDQRQISEVQATSIFDNSLKIKHGDINFIIKKSNTQCWIENENGCIWSIHDLFSQNYPCVSMSGYKSKAGIYQIGYLQSSLGLDSVGLYIEMVSDALILSIRNKDKINASIDGNKKELYLDLAAISSIPFLASVYLSWYYVTHLESTSEV